jgi:hypothetical protein
LMRKTNFPLTITTSAWMSWGCTTQSHYPWTDGKIYVNYGTTVRKIIVPSWDLFSWHVLEMRSKAAHWSMWIDGVQVHATSVNTFCLPVAPNLGGIPGGQAYWDLCELMEFSKIKTNPEALLIVDYLRDVGGLP